MLVTYAVLVQGASYSSVEPELRIACSTFCYAAFNLTFYMKLGFVTAILPELNLEQVFQFAAAEGFDSVELMCWPVGKAERKFAGVTHIDVTDLTKTRAEEVQALAAKHGVTISGLGYYPNPLDPDPAWPGQPSTISRKSSPPPPNWGSNR